MGRLTIAEIPGEGDGPSKFCVRNRETDITAPATELPDPHAWPVAGAGDQPLMIQLRWYLETFLSYPFDPYTQRAEQIETALKAWGTEAFKCLFNNRDAGNWVPTEAGADFDLIISSDRPEYLAWPWEALHDPRIGYFGHRARIQRRLSKDAPDPAAVPDDLPRDCIHILLVTARPYKNDVDYRSISRPLVDLIREEKLPANVQVLRPPTFDNLKRHLGENQGRYHILHFDGHGGYGMKASDAPSAENQVYLRGAEGRLLFEDAKGQADEISAEKLATLLAGCGIPYVVLNACRSAALDEHAHEGSAFASVAGALVKAGFRGVLAMSHNLTVAGAAQFLPEFYRELFASGNLLEAARSGRLEMVREARRSAWNPKVELKDWLLPVVYQQRDDFDLSFARQAQPPAPDIELSADFDRFAARNFVGRDAAIQALERQWRRSAPAILVHGLGGIGKTSLAVHFIQWLRDTGGLQHPPFWFSFDDIRSASHVFNQIGRALAGAKFDGDQPEMVAQLAQVLKEQVPLTLVWDNFESARGFAADHASALLPDEDLTRLKDFLTALEGGRTTVLITSRGDEPWLPESICHRLRLGGLRGEELWDYAAAIMEELDQTVDRNDPTTRELLEEKLAGHPILVRTVLSQLRNGDLKSLSERVEKNLGELLQSEADAEHHRLLAALDVLRDGLDDQERACLIPIALHERFVDLDYLHEMGEKSGQVKHYDRAVMERVFAILTAAGLVSELGQNVFTLHPLLTSYLGSNDDPAEESASWRRAFVDFMGSLANHFAPKPLHEQREVFALHHANFHSALAHTGELQMEDKFAALTQSLAVWAQNTLDYPEARRLFADLAVRRQALGDHQFEAGAYHQLGRIAQEQRDFAGAEKWYLKSLAIKEKQGNEHGAAITYHQLGIIAQEQRDFAGAEKWYLKSLAIEEKQGNEHGAAITYHQLGSIAEEQRDFAGAEKWYLKSLAISEKQGNEHYAAMTYHQLGRIAEEQRDFAGAEKWYLKSLAIKEKQGNEHGAASTYHQLGRIAQEQRDFAGAGKFALKALAIYANAGDSHNLGIAARSLARVLSACQAEIGNELRKEVVELLGAEGMRQIEELVEEMRKSNQ